MPRLILDGPRRVFRTMAGPELVEAFALGPIKLALDEPFTGTGIPTLMKGVAGLHNIFSSNRWDPSEKRVYLRA